MRLISYRRGRRDGIGVMVDDTRFISLATAAPDLPTTMLGLLRTKGWQSKVRRAIKGRRPNSSLDKVELLPLIPDAPVIWCVGVNYKEHQEETGRGKQEAPMLFLRVCSGLLAAGAPMVRPKVSEQLDFEGELAVIIGKEGRAIPESEAMDHIAGYSIFNDGSIRDWQYATSQFGAGKNFEATGTFGPWLMTPGEFGDPYKQLLTTRLNGQVMQHTAVANMDHKIERLINYISTAHTLRPGDVISTGTPGGVGGRRKPPVWMKPGDTVEIEITGLGIARNPIVAEK